MNMIVKSAAVLGLTGAMALAAMSPSEARSGRWAAAGVGFAAGALVGAAAANSNRGYYYDDYAYAPGPVYYDNAPAYRYHTPAYSSGYAVDSYAYQPTYRYQRRGMTGPHRENQLTSSDY